MKCPQCTAELVGQRSCGVDIDLCTACGGVWFDAGELDAYRSSVGLVAGDASPVTPHFRPTPDSARGRCPRCAADSLLPGTLGHHLLHRCSSCSGVYLSRAELEKVSKSPNRRYAEGAAKAAGEAAWYPDLLIEGALNLLAGIFDGV